LALLCGIVALSTSASAVAAPSCDAACLTRLADEYLRHLAANDPSGLPLGTHFRASENAKTIRLGEGAWGKATGVAQQQVLVEPDKGEVVAYSLLKLKHGNVAAYAVRLKVTGQLIAEAEALNGNTEISAAQMAKSSVNAVGGATPIPAAQRMSRQSLVNTAEHFFKALKSGNEASGRFAPDCYRIDGVYRATCVGTVHEGAPGNLRPRNVRTFLVDPALGLVGSFFFLDMYGMKPIPDLPTAPPEIHLYSVVLTRVENDKIVAVWEIATQVQKDSRSPFESR